MSAAHGHVGPPPRSSSLNGVADPISSSGDPSRSFQPPPTFSATSSNPSFTQTNGHPSGPRQPRRPLPSDPPPTHSTSSAAAPSSTTSPSELKRRRVSSSLPSSFALTDPPPPHPPPSPPLDSYDAVDGGAHLALLNGTATAYQRRKDLDPDDKYSDKHSVWRRLWTFLSPPPPLHHSSRPRPPSGGWGRRCVEGLAGLWDAQRPVVSILRLLGVSVLSAAILLLLTLLLRGDPAALSRVTHPLSHLSPFFLSSRGNRTVDPLLLSPELNAYDFTIVASFFSNAQSSTSSSRILQWHSLLSFVSLVPPSHLLIYTNSPTDCAQFIQQTFEDLQCFQFTEAIHPDLNLPYVPALLTHAHTHAKTDLIVYAHHDVLLAPELAGAIHHLVDTLPHHSFLATSRRIDFRLPPDMVFIADFSVPLTEAIVGGGRHVGRVYPNEWNIDLLIYSRTHFQRVLGDSMPPFVYSDYYWGNFLLGSFLLAQGDDMAVVDLTAQRLVIHQKTNDTVDGIYVTDMKALAQHNLRVARNHSDVYLYGSLTNIPYTLTGACPSCYIQPNLDAGVLLLARRQAQDNWLVVMDIDTASSTPVIHNWLCWAQRANVTNYLLIATSTAADHRALYEAGFPVLFATAGTGPAASTIVSYLLQYGFHVLSMDWDHLLVQSPFPYLQASPYDVMVKGEEHNLYSGLLAIRSSHYSHYYWDLALTCLTQQSQIADVEHRLDCYTSTFRDVRALVQGGLLDILHFPTVQSFFKDQLSQRTGTIPYVLETSPRAIDLARLHIARDGLTCEAPQRPPFPPLTDSYPIVVRILTSSHVDHLKALLASLSAARYDGAAIDLEIAIDYPHANATEDERKGYEQTVEMASTYVWTHGQAMVTVQDTERVGSARLIHADVDLDRLAYVLVLTDEVVLSSQWYPAVRHLLSLYSDDPQLMALSLTAENDILGETQTLRSFRRRAFDETQTAPPLFFWQRPSSALLFLPYHWVELVIWMRVMQARWPSYHPCVPTLITNHRTGWQEWVSKWMYERGMYALHTNWPQRSVLAMKVQEGVEPKYEVTLVNVKSFGDMRIAELQREEEGRRAVYDFHLRLMPSALPLLTRAQLQATSKQCWAMDDWKTDEAKAPNLSEDELMTEDEEVHRHAKQRRRHAQPHATANTSAAAAPLKQEDDLAGHAVTEQMVAGVRPLRKAGSKGKGGKAVDAWADAAAAAIAESQEKGAQELSKEQAAAKKREQQQQPQPSNPAAAEKKEEKAPPKADKKPDKAGKEGDKAAKKDGKAR